MTTEKKHGRIRSYEASATRRELVKLIKHTPKKCRKEIIKMVREITKNLDKQKSK
jgi:hypothetical protein